MADVLDITQVANMSSLCDAMSCGSTVRHAVIVRGCRKVPGCRLMWPVDSQEIQGWHNGFANTCDSGVTFVNNALIGGKGSMLMKDRKYVFHEDVYPSYVKYYIQNDILPELWVVPDKRLMLPRCLAWVVTTVRAWQPMFFGSAERRFSVPA